jgi:hypothetical protein
MKPDRLDEAIKIFRENNLPEIIPLKGLISYSVLLDRNTGKGATIIHFDTEENMLASEESGLAQKQRDRFKDHWVGQYIVDRYEVCAHC